MKKIFTLATLLVLAITANAQETYRKSWDFTKWSATTVANLQAESAKGPKTGAWSDVEKDTATEPTDLSKDNCFWEVTAQGNASEGATLMANGEVISELDGLLYTNTAARSLAIAVNYQVANASDAAFGPYHGASYLWLGSSKKNYFVIPHVAPGTVIKMGIESHKTSEARGVELYLGFGTSGTKLKDPDGNDVAAPTTYQDQEWLVPENATDTPNEDGTYNVQVYNTNGCHIYYITVGDGDSPESKTWNAAYIYEGDEFVLDDDYAYLMIEDNSSLNVTKVNVTEGFTAATLSENYDVVVVAPSVTAEHAAAIKDLIAFIPVVNLNSDIYETMGLGKAVETETNLLTITDATSAIFEDLEGEIEYDDVITGVELGEYFANDAVLAKAGDVVGIHTHNPGRNAYYYVPGKNTGASEDVLITLIPQTAVVAAKTKRDIAAVGTPVITVDLKDRESVVTITAANSNAIYYTTDGNEPTVNSTLYTEPFSLTSAATVKAFATGDGYTNSQVVEKEVKIAVAATAPEITVTSAEGKATIEISGSDEGTTVYYNFTGSTVLTEAVKYSAPIELSHPAIIYAFATGGDYLNSTVVGKFVEIDGIDAKNVRWDIVAHFDANADNWSGKGQQKDENGAIINANYFFTWGKNAGEYWDESSAEIVGDTIIYTRTLEPETYKPEDENWIIKSIGQVLTWEKLDTKYNIGDTSYRNPESAEDAIGVNDSIGFTNNAITFGKQPTGGPFNASLESTVKFKAPFDVVVYAGNGNNGELPTMQVETSADGQNWEKLGDIKFSLIQRNWKKTHLSYEGTDEVYVRIVHTAAKSSGQIYDLYVMAHGEDSEQKYEDVVTGIVDVETAPAGEVVRTEIFSLGGTRMQNVGRGISIVRQTYANGVVVTKKVVNK